MTFLEQESPVYAIHQYREDFFKVVRFKGSRGPRIGVGKEPEHYENKLDPAYSRARSMVLQYGLCNDWQYFFTGTIDKLKFDRFDLDIYYRSLSQWIRDQRKKLDSQIQFLLVPEHHKKDGAWHIHGMVANLPESETEKFVPPAPPKLVAGGYLNWPAYQKKFGFCSLGRIRNPVATAFYVSKYVSKELSKRSGDVGQHLYFHSRPLRKAQKSSEVYCFSPVLEKVCLNDYHFCKTGMVNAPWYFPYVHEGADFAAIDLTPVDPLPSFDPRSIDPFYEQLTLTL